MFYVYLIVTKNKKKLISYVGYTNNLDKRINLHNSSKGAKFTKGRIWKLIYYKKFNSKKRALKEEYKLKKNYKLRSKIKNNYIKNENFNFTSL
jgi:putative endonuclease